MTGRCWMGRRALREGNLLCTMDRKGSKEAVSPAPSELGGTQACVCHFFDILKLNNSVRCSFGGEEDIFSGPKELRELPTVSEKKKT